MESGLPQGYEEIGAITLAAGRAAGVQALSLLLGLATLVALLLASGVRSFTAGPGDILAVLAGTLGVVALHEGVHWLAYAIWGLRPRFGAGVVHGMPVLVTTVDGPYGRTPALVGLIAPLVLIDGLFLAASAAVPGLLALAALPVAMNTAGSAGDLWLAARLARFSPGVMVADVPDGLLVYGRARGKGGPGREPPRMP